MEDTGLTTVQKRLLGTQRELKQQRTAVVCCVCGSTRVLQHPSWLECQECHSIAELDRERFAAVQVLRNGEERTNDAILDVRQWLTHVDPPSPPGRPRRLLVAGPGESGKDHVCRWFDEHTELRYTGSTSWWLSQRAAEAWNEDAADIYRERRDRRQQLFDFGAELRKDDPGILVKDSLQDGDIVCGARDVEEVQAARTSNIVDLILWVARDSAPDDPTMTFGPEQCDLVLENHGSVDELHGRLQRLSRVIGYPPDRDEQLNS